MLTTNYQTGTPNWIDVGTPNVEAASEFYSSLFGWEFSSLGPDAGGYGQFTLDGKVTAAIGPLTEDGARSAWTVYFQSSDAEATAGAVEQAGGQVRVAPMDVFDKGRMAAFTDPTDAEFAVWEPWETSGLGIVTKPNTLCWTELHTGDSGSAKVFYQAIFGWDFVENSSEEFPYTVLRPAGGDDMTNLGGIIGFTDDSGVMPHWRPYFEVTDCDAAVAKAEQGGGAVVCPATDLEGVGRMAALTDPFGASFSVITSASA